MQPYGAVDSGFIQYLMSVYDRRASMREIASQGSRAKTNIRNRWKPEEPSLELMRLRQHAEGQPSEEHLRSHHDCGLYNSAGGHNGSLPQKLKALSGHI
jgi:hypothetical protein